jgi:hypothetical protein
LGELRIPCTSGLLIGIGETRRERLEALLALRELHRVHGHLQEVIIQNFRAKPGTAMARAPEPSLEEQLWTIAVARLVFGSSMSIQAPPNLQPDALEALHAVARAPLGDRRGHLSPARREPAREALPVGREELHGVGLRVPDGVVDEDGLLAVRPPVEAVPVAPPPGRRARGRRLRDGVPQDQKVAELAARIYETGTRPSRVAIPQHVYNAMFRQLRIRAARANYLKRKAARLGEWAREQGFTIRP